MKLARHPLKPLARYERHSSPFAGNISRIMLLVGVPGVNAQLSARSANQAFDRVFQQPAGIGRGDFKANGGDWAARFSHCFFH